MTTTYPLPAIVVDPGGGSTAVSITTPSGTTPTVYQDRFGVTPWTMPTVIGAATLFYLPDPGAFVVNGVATVNVETTQVATVNLGVSPGQWMPANQASRFVEVVEVSAAFSSSKNKTRIDNKLFRIAANGGGHLVVEYYGPAPSLGGHVVPSGTRVSMMAGGWRPSVSVTENALQMDPSNPYGFMFAGNEWANNTALADVGIIVDHCTLDMNGTSAYGVAVAGRNCTIRRNNIWNWAGAFSGIACGSNSNTTATLNNNKIQNNIVQIATPTATSGQHGIWLPNLGSKSVTDTDIDDNLLNGCGDNIIHLDSGGDNNCRRNHGSTLVADGSSFIYYNLMAGARVIDNQMDDTSRPNVSGQTNSILHIAQVAPTWVSSTSSLPNRPNIISINTFHADEGHLGNGNLTAAATWNYIQIDAVQGQSGNKTGYVGVWDNSCTQDRAGSGTSTAYTFNCAATQTLNVRLRVGQVVGTSATPSTGGGGTVNVTNPG